MTIGLLFLLAVVALMLVGVVPHFLAYLLLGMSALTFWVYARDKSASEKRRRRTPEDSLHLLALFGGWPGALIAQQGFRHKNRKRSFQTVFWTTVVLNLMFVAWVLVYL